jgi:hypothetical protein
MPQVVFDKFSSGLDRRKSRDTAGADALFELTNAHVNAGQELVKRACASLQLELESGSVGLRAALGKLNTFTTDRTLVHGNPLVRANFVPHPTDSTRTIAKIHYCEAFRGYLYVVVEYDNGSVFHHYLDAGSASAKPRDASPKWAASTAYVTNPASPTFGPSYVTPTTPNGFRYECTVAGTSGATEPAWPTTLGATVVSGGATFTCRSFVITDTNCPQTKSVVKVQEKLYAVKGEVVRFCAAANARDWTTASDAGFLATGSYQDDSSEALAVGKFKSALAVFFADAVQVWAADPDPSLTALSDTVPHVGTRFPRAVGQVSQETLFLSDNGFRSIALSVNTDQLQDSDIGAPIDSIVKPLIATLTDPFSEWYAGQLWTVCGADVFAFTFSRASKVNAWSRFRFPWNIEDAAALNGKLYLREGNNAYLLDENTHQDGDSAPEVVIEMPFIDCKAPGALKLFQGVDWVGEGSASISFRYRTTDANGNPTEGITDPVILLDNSMPGVMTPVELCATAIAPRITHRANEAFSMSRLALYYELLGPN